MSSAREGAWTRPVRVPGEAALGGTGVVLAAFNNRLYLAWTGTDGRGNLRSSATGTNWALGDKVTLNEWSNKAPSLLRQENYLYLGWVETDSRLNVKSSTTGTNFATAANIT